MILHSLSVMQICTPVADVAGLPEPDRAEKTRQDKSLSSKERSDMIVQIVSKLDTLQDPDKRKAVSIQLFEAISAMDEGQLGDILSRDFLSEEREHLFDDLISLLDDDTLDRLESKIKQTEERMPDHERRSGEDRRTNDSLGFLIKGGIDRRNRRDKRKSRLLHVQLGLNSILKGQTEVFLDKKVMLAVPGVVEKMLSRGNAQAARNLIQKLCEGQLDEREDIRIQASAALARINHGLASSNRISELFEVASKLMPWIELETTVSRAYEHICHQLRAVAQALVRRQRIGECNRLLTPFHHIHSGKLVRDAKIRMLAAGLLKEVGSNEVLSLLRGLQDDDPHLCEPAAKTLAMIGSQPLAEEAEPSPGVNSPETDERQSPPDSDLEKQLKAIDQCVSEDRTGEAAKILSELIEKHAKARDFSTADMLRDKLVEIDPLSLARIVAANEVIEREKSEGIDQDHLEFWQALYGALGKEEVNALFYAMTSNTCGEGEVIIRQGESNPNLYFIDKGQFKVVFHKGEEEFLVRELNPGDVVGEDSFHHMSIATLSVVALAPAEFHVLGKDSMEEWKADFPALVSKLKHYCATLAETPDLLKENGQDRRIHKRVKVQTKVTVSQLDSADKRIAGPVLGTLADISRGGVCFYIKAPKEKAKALFDEPRLSLRFLLNSDGSEHRIERNGKVVGIHFHMYEYAVSVTFDELLDDALIEGIDPDEQGEIEILEMA